MNFSSSLKIVVRTKAEKNEVVGFDENRQAYKINIKAPPENNKANIEIIKFFSKLSGKNVKIISGLKSKQKILRFF